MKSFALGLLGAAALTTILVVRKQQSERSTPVPATGGRSAEDKSWLERIRESGL